jgi:hypothetical protein
LHDLTLASRKPVSAAKVRLYRRSQVFDPAKCGRPPIDVGTRQQSQFSSSGAIRVCHVANLSHLPAAKA